MTEKRFTITQDFEEHYRQIRDNGKVVMGCFLEPQAEVIVDLLNEQHEELGNRKRIIKAITNEYYELENAHKTTYDIAYKTLQKNYDFAQKQCLNNLDNAIIHKSYDLLKQTIIDIANELEVELKL